MFTFTDDYKIGIKQIDEEHEQLVALINGTEKMLAENNTELQDRKSTRLNSSHMPKSRMPSSA